MRELTPAFAQPLAASVETDAEGSRSFYQVEGVGTFTVTLLPHELVSVQLGRVEASNTRYQGTPAELPVYDNATVKGTWVGSAGGKVRADVRFTARQGDRRINVAMPDTLRSEITELCHAIAFDWSQTDGKEAIVAQRREASPGKREQARREVMHGLQHLVRAVRQVSATIAAQTEDAALTGVPFEHDVDDAMLADLVFEVRSAHASGQPIISRVTVNDWAQAHGLNFEAKASE